MKFCQVDESEPGEIGDIVGKCRILEALKSHTWSTMQIIPSPADQQRQGQVKPKDEPCPVKTKMNKDRTF